MENYINIDKLPKIIKRDNINWIECINITIDFYFNGITGNITIIKPVDNYRVLILYLNKEYFINKSSLLSCKLSEIVKINKPYRYNIGEIIEDAGRNLSVLNREYRKRESLTKNEMVKWYRCKCHRCGTNDAWISEQHLKEGRGCPVCHSKKVCIGTNDIPTTAPWMIPYFQGGYDEARLYTKCSEKMIYPICPDCGKIKDKKMKVKDIYKIKSITCSCSDKISYPEKLMYSILNDLDINFVYQYSPKWCNYMFKDKLRKGKYDFYFELNNKKYIIETDGGFHKKDNRMSGQTKEESKYIDTLKDILAKEREIEVIRIDCIESDLDYIKTNIINSKLSDIFDLSLINWNNCQKNSLHNIVKITCDIKMKNINFTSNDISKILKISQGTIVKYLKIGTKLGWCNYNAKEEIYKNNMRKSKMIEIFKNNISLGVFNSSMELSRKSKELFDTVLYDTCISNVAKGRYKTHKGYTIKYVNKNQEVDELKTSTSFSM